MTMIVSNKGYESTINDTGLKLNFNINLINDSDYFNQAVYDHNKYFEIELILFETYNTTLKLNMINCPADYFQTLDNSNWYTQDNILCPDKTSIEKISMNCLKYADFTSFSLTIKLKLEFIKEIDEVRKLFSQNTIYAQMYFIDNFINFENSANPVTYYINYRAQYINIDTIYSENVFFTPTIFSNDTNLFFSNPIPYSLLKYDRSEYFLINANNRSNNFTYNRDVMSFYFLMNPFKLSYTQTFQKFPDYLANVTSLSSQIFNYTHTNSSIF